MKRILGVAAAAAIVSAATNNPSDEALEPASRSRLSSATDILSPTAQLLHQKGFRFEYISSDQDDIEVDVNISASDSEDDEPDISVTVVPPHGEPTSTAASVSSLYSTANTSRPFESLPSAGQNFIGAQVQKAYDGYGYYGGYQPGYQGGYQGGSNNPPGYNDPYLSQHYRNSPLARPTLVPPPISSALNPTITSVEASQPTPRPLVTTSDSPDYYRGYNDGWLSAQKTNGFLSGFSEGESDGYSSGFTVGFRAAQTGAEADSFKTAYLEGETHGYYDGYFDGEQHNSYQYTQTYVPAIGSTLTKTTSLPFVTTSAPRAPFSLSFEADSTSAIPRAYSSYEVVSPSGTAGPVASEYSSDTAPSTETQPSTSPLVAATQVRPPIQTTGLGNELPYGYGYGYGYPPPYPNAYPPGFNGAEPFYRDEVEDTDSESNDVHLKKRGIISDMFRGNRQNKQAPAVNYAPPPLQVAPPAPAYQYPALQPCAQPVQVQALQPCAQPYQVQAIQPRLNDVYSGGGYYAPQPAYGYNYGGFQGEGLTDEAGNLFSQAMQCVTSLLNPETYCPGIFGGSDPQPYYYQPQPYYYQPAYQQPTYQQQPAYVQPSYQQPQFLASYVLPQSQCYYVAPASCDDGDSGIPTTSPVYPPPQPVQGGQSAETSPYAEPSYVTQYSTSSPQPTGINSGDPSQLFVDQYQAQAQAQAQSQALAQAQAADQARQQQINAQVERDLSNAQALLAQQRQQASAPVEQYQQAQAPVRQYLDAAAPAEQNLYAVSLPEQYQQPPAPSSAFQPIDGPRQAYGGSQQAAVAQDGNDKPKKLHLSLGGGERLNVFPPYATKTPSNA